MNNTTLSVLIADDNEWHRNILQDMLQIDGHTVYLAQDGEEAVSVYEANHPDVILMDVMMPVLDGIEATRRIKAIAGKNFIPITFITSLANESWLVRCLEVGGDDFIVKPVNLAILRAKLAAAARVRQLYDDIVDQRQDLSVHHEYLRYEYEVAEKIFAKIVGSVQSNSGNIRSVLEPLAAANGDLLLVGRTPAGNQHVLLGDYTGHGLAAAMGAIPVTEIFNAMTLKGFGIREIVREMNRKLHATLPTGQFLAACMLEWDPRRDTVRVWNGGLPDLIMVHGLDNSMTRFPSRNLPLGIESDVQFRIETDVRHAVERNRIYLYSDGFIEARNADGLMFGEERLEMVVLDNCNRDRLFDEIINAVRNFRDNQPQDDDMTFVEVICEQRLCTDDKPVCSNTAARTSCDYSIKLDAAAMKRFDTTELVKGLANGFAFLEQHQTFLYAIVTELYTNALDHGVLALDYSVKDEDDGFTRYYLERERLLSKLVDGWIHIDIEIQGNESSGQVILKVEDSGQGFDHGRIRSEADRTADEATHGRGLSVVRALCKSLSHDARGNSVRAVYLW